MVGVEMWPTVAKTEMIINNVLLKYYFSQNL